MAAGKWIGGFLGFMTAGPLGALAGFALGSLFDHGLDEVNREGYNNREYDDIVPIAGKLETVNKAIMAKIAIASSKTTRDSATVSCSRSSFSLPTSSMRMAKSCIPRWK